MLETSTLQCLPDGTPFSARYGDVYHSAAGGLAQARHVFLAGNGLPTRWRERARFVILETGFGLGLNFLATWQAWLADPQACRELCFISLEKHPFSAADLAAAHAAWPELAALAGALRRLWPPLRPGEYRVRLEDAAREVEMETEASNAAVREAAVPMKQGQWEGGERKEGEASEKLALGHSAVPEMPGAPECAMARRIPAAPEAVDAPDIAEAPENADAAVRRIGPRIERHVELRLLFGDATALLPGMTATPESAVDAFYLDGFSPARNPVLWSPELCRALARLASPGATLATWSVAGSVRRALADAGFSVEKCPGFAGKRQMLVGRWPGPAGVAGSVI